MTQIVWDNSYSTGIDQFDEQHKQLFGMINQLFEAMRTGKGGAFVADLISKLEQYVATHFKEEEERFKKFSYPHAIEHIKEHKMFIEEIEKYKQNLKVSSVGVPIKLLNFLKDWLTHHIMESDKKYGPYLKG